MHGMRHCRARNSGHSAFWLLSVFALLAFACFPLLAQADSTGAQYEDAVPVVTGHKTPPSGPPAHLSKTGGGAPAHTGTVPGSKGGSSKDNPSATGNGAGTESNGATDQGSPANGSNDKTPTPQQGSQLAGSTSSSGSGSSPLVPILIAIAALAAISIGAVMVRQRRQRRGPGASVSPKAS